MFMRLSDQRFGLSAADIIAAHPLTSFAVPFEPLPGYVKVQDSPAPTHDPETHKLVEGQPVADGDAWVQTWTVVELTPEELEARKPPVPLEVNRAQALLALHHFGYLAAVQPAINAIQDPDLKARAQIEWDHRPTFLRTSPVLAMLAEGLELDAADLDQLFLYASTQ